MRRTLVAIASVAIALALVASAASALSGRVMVAGHASNDGDTPAYVAKEGRESVAVAFDGNGVRIEDDLAPFNVTRGVVAFVGLLSDGAQGGTAGLWGSVVVEEFACSWQTWGGVGNGPRASCLP